MTPPLIIRRIDAALATMRSRGMAPRAIYLTATDYKLYARADTARWRRELGGNGPMWPTSYGEVPLISKKLIGEMVPVRETKGKKGSTIYSTHGVSVAVPKRLPATEVRKAA